MKITKQQLNHIIQEELRNVLNEFGGQTDPDDELFNPKARKGTIQNIWNTILDLQARVEALEVS